jgi:prepilin-type N-terminal cleavage/methylation domain-containing protein
MFSRTLSKGPRPGIRSGFSLLELLASLLLIAAIAVLSFPTYQDFTPHEATLNDRPKAPADKAREAADPLPAGSKVQDQPEPQPVSNMEDRDKPPSKEGEIGE